MRKAIKKDLTYVIILPGGEKITIGSGISNVPTSSDSVKTTDIKKIIKAAKEASKAGIFDTESDDYGSNLQTPTS